MKKNFQPEIKEIAGMIVTEEEKELRRLKIEELQSRESVTVKELAFMIGVPTSKVRKAILCNYWFRVNQLKTSKKGSDLMIKQDEAQRLMKVYHTRHA